MPTQWSDPMPTTILEKCRRYAHEALSRMEQGDRQETLEWLAVNGGKITDSASDRRLQRCEHAGGVLIVKSKVTAVVGTWSTLSMEVKEELWAELRMILREVAGLEPIRVHERERKGLTDHWCLLYRRGDERTRGEIVRKALKRYSDFDVRVFGLISEGVRPY